MITKEKMKELIEQQPDDATYEEILRELAFAGMVERGLADARQGRTVSHEEMGKRIRLSPNRDTVTGLPTPAPWPNGPAASAGGRR